MAKIVNCWNEWDPLKRVVLGRPEGTSIPAPEPAWIHNLASAGMGMGYSGPFPEDMVEAAIRQENDFVKILEKRGIIVDRVQVPAAFQDGRAIVTPEWAQIGLHGVNNPRDLFLPLGNEIMEAPGSRRSRFFEYLCMRDLFEKWFREDPDFRWTAAPRPRLSDDSFVYNYYWDYDENWSEEVKKEKLLNWEFHLTEKEPLWDAADACRAGRDIFWQASAVTNKAGMEWLRRYLSDKGIRLHPVLFDSSPGKRWRPWHIDVTLTLARPGLAIVCPDKIMPPDIENLFRKNDWEIVEAARPVYDWNESRALCADRHGVHGPNWISMNTLSLGPKTICVMDKEEPYMKQLDKLGLEVVPLAYEKVYPFGGMIHCSTLDVFREGGLEDYFPNQQE